VNQVDDAVKSVYTDADVGVRDLETGCEKGVCEGGTSGIGGVPCRLCHRPRIAIRRAKACAHPRLDVLQDYLYVAT
jgi:hypothetical protein